MDNLHAGDGVDYPDSSVNSSRKWQGEPTMISNLLNRTSHVPYAVLWTASHIPSVGGSKVATAKTFLCASSVPDVPRIQTVNVLPVASAVEPWVTVCAGDVVLTFSPSCSFHAGSVAAVDTLTVTHRISPEMGI